MGNLVPQVFSIALVALSLSLAIGQDLAGTPPDPTCDKECRQSKLNKLNEQLSKMDAAAQSRLTLAAPTTRPVGTGHDSLLAAISSELKYVRSLPPGTRTTFECPKDTDQLVGLSEVQLRSFLGQPDSEQPAADFAQRVPQYWTYTIGSPSPLEAGGGFPELSSHFDDLGKVRGTMCALAK
ncbi:hypothetical protein [Rhodanobacter sp. MP7CTX1]|uniref:hypothetical protein n=1 Tax=Rhodanobacter sp. MP7CTX1 TaxID=2723084 RepID=UPI00161579D7|nr:hypothetical protein [Rhodanobacter sp. MP7CTX1]MBB6187699.1 hypothetical protein [Rhodanobacter sp. MP7CTX1]